MAKYLIQGSYTQAGLDGLLKDGGTKRRDAAKQALEGVGGTMESYYLAFGEHDFYLIADIPDNVGATA
ncbi:MAG: GYD domain-containing protein, partial [Anaerolineales bacterium]|nr:GYD domain-containing protein [Anaerolineales bacterium]